MLNIEDEWVSLEATAQELLDCLDDMVGWKEDEAPNFRRDYLATILATTIAGSPSPAIKEEAAQFMRGRAVAVFEQMLAWMQEEQGGSND